jgi:hypothetical protein
VSRRVGEPTGAELESLAATLAPGQQRAVGGGVYLCIDGNGRMRFQFRLRSAGAQSRNAGGTYDSQHLLGLYQRVPLTRRGSFYTGVLPDKITLFHGPLDRRYGHDESLLRARRCGAWSCMRSRTTLESATSG